MADVLLSRPQAGQQVVVPTPVDSRLVLQFPVNETTLEKAGNNLLFKFNDGSRVELPNFYAEFSKDNIPDFVVDGRLVTGADFFNAVGPDLSPAAGPAAAAAAAVRGGRYTDWGNSNLADGIRHLDGLDWGMNLAGREDYTVDTLGSTPYFNAAPISSLGGTPLSLVLKEAGVRDGGNVPEPGTPTMSGSFTVTDPDGDTLTAVVMGPGGAVPVSGVTTVATPFGTLTVTPVGGGSAVTYNVAYTLNNADNSQSDRLAQGESHTDVFSIQIADGRGNTVAQPVTVRIEGSNDAPDITGVDDLSLKEQGVFAGNYGVPDLSNTLDPKENTATLPDGVAAGQHRISMSGQIAAVDPDHGHVLTYGVTDMAGNALTAGSVIGAGPSGGVTVTGVNAADPTNIVISTNYGDLHLNSTTGTYSFNLTNMSGEGATNKLAEGQTVALQFRPTVHDEHNAVDLNCNVLRDGSPAAGGNIIDVSIRGANDQPVFAGNAGWAGGALGLTESSDPLSPPETILGQMTATDHDNGAVLTYGFAHNGNLVATLYAVPTGVGHGYTLETTPPAGGNYFGTFTMTNQTNGSYSFTLNNAASCVDSLDDGDRVNISANLAARDEFGAWNTTPLAVQIKGSNDAPVFDDGPYAGAVKESGVYAAGEKTTALVGAENAPASGANATFSGDLALHAHDVDAGETLTFGLALGGAAVAEKTLYAVSDGAGGYTLSTAAPVGNNYYGSLTMGADGKYAFTVNNTTGSPADKLPEGGEFKLAFTPTVSDGTVTTVADAAHRIEITIKGTNDAPVLSGGDKLVVTEQGFANPGSPAAVSGLMAATDVDSDDAGKLSFSLVQNPAAIGGGAAVPLYTTLYVVDDGLGNPVLSATNPTPANCYGTLTMGSGGADAGKYTFTLNNSATVVQQMDDGGVKNLSFTVAVQDTHGAYDYKPVDLSIKGSNDVPAGLTVWGEKQVRETGVYAAGGTGYPDILNPNENKATQAGGTAPGQHKLTASGTLAAMDYEGDAIGYSLLTSVTTLALADWSQAPAGYTQANAQAVTNEWGTLYLKTLPGTAHVGNINVNNSDKIEYVFVLNDQGAKVNALAEGNSQTISFGVNVFEADTPSVSSVFSTPLTFTITGANDKPVLDMVAGTPGVEGSAALVITEDGGVYVGQGQVSASDADAGDVAQIRIATTAGKLVATAFVDKNGNVVESVSGSDYYGRIVIQPDGKYTFEINNNAPCVQSMSGGELIDLPITIVAQDKYGAFDTGVLHVKLTGQDDKTVLDVDMLNPTHTLVEAGVLPGGNTYYAGKAIAEGVIKATDPDTGDTLHYSVQGKDGVWRELGKLTDPTCDNTDPAHPKWVIAAAHGVITVTDNGDGT